jgi:magnesium transporter
VHHYLGHLKVIKQLTVELGSKISASMENRYLLQMFALSESLIYYLNAIEANAAVLTKLGANAERLALPKQDVEFLHDVMLDNQQCARQAQIYSSVLSGLMDARGTIVNNNVNVLLKNLTLINVIFLPLTLIASIGGMSEFSMMTQGVDWRVSYALLVGGNGRARLGDLGCTGADTGQTTDQTGEGQNLTPSVDGASHPCGTEHCVEILKAESALYCPI